MRIRATARDQRRISRSGQRGSLGSRFSVRFQLEILSEQYKLSVRTLGGQHSVRYRSTLEDEEDALAFEIDDLFVKSKCSMPIESMGMTLTKWALTFRS